MVWEGGWHDDTKFEIKDMDKILRDVLVNDIKLYFWISFSGKGGTGVQITVMSVSLDFV